MTACCIVMLRYVWSVSRIHVMCKAGSRVIQCDTSYFIAQHIHINNVRFNPV